MRKKSETQFLVGRVQYEGDGKKYFGLKGELMNSFLRCWGGGGLQKLHVCAATYVYFDESVGGGQRKYLKLAKMLCSEGGGEKFYGFPY